MIFIDYFFMIIILGSTLFGMYRGFTRELLSLIGLIVAYYCAIHFSDIFIAYVPINFNESVNQLIAYITIFVVTIFIIGFFIKQINKSVEAAGLSLINFFFGGLFGFFRGALISLIILFVVQKINPTIQENWKTSVTIPLLNMLLKKTSPYLPIDELINVKYKEYSDQI